MSPRREAAMVPDASFRSYYGRPVLKKPVWKARDIAGYFFLGGLAGASSVVAAGAHLTARPGLRRASKLGALSAITLSAAALVHDLGRPGRFAHMLRVFKPTSPMSVGSWLLAAYGPAAGIAAASEVTGVLPSAGTAATLAAAALGPVVASYTAVLIADTAVPAWHDGYRELPFVFAGSAAVAAAGVGLLGAPVAENAPVRRLGVAGAVAELAASRELERRLGATGEPYERGKAARFLKLGQALTAAGLGAAVLGGRRSRLVAAASGVALLAASACTRFGIFHAGVDSAGDPAAVIVAQRERAGATLNH